ncbi:M1 family metallopeptidase [Lysobacter yananisis]|uniref:Aminopeptidase N n=1 Tax=Lysobacter yananisis TaxID=1003114 RepID=A0ABY9P7Z3_9GAMM|nr:M1 family metallopeptidase [Lysobacter yananisis]WMT03188.1 M1 family metallopeptidase [Lysobacter yananisis]
MPAATTPHRPSRLRARLAAALAAAALAAPIAAAAQGAAAARAGANLDVLHYTARVEPDIAGKTLRGQVSIRLALRAEGAQQLEFDAGELEIEKVSERGRALVFEKVEQRLRVRLPQPGKSGERHEIDVVYRGAPRYGLEFHPERGEVYTIFSTSQWLVCIDAPSERASLDLTLTVPSGLKAVGNGRLVSKSALGGRRDSYRWRQDQPMPSYVYGFAAGRYNEAGGTGENGELRFLSAELEGPQLRKLFGDSADMLRFFGRRAGIRYRGTYSQVLVAKTVGQELDGFALLSEAYGREVLEKPEAQGLIAHELAHQWWGNMVTNRDWGQFWLNEGFANFMAAAYLEHRFGEAAYRERVDSWKRRVDKLRESGKDHALVYANWNKPTADDRAVVYQKGAYVLHLLREELGERAFWRGVRTYTRAYYGHSVTSADLRQVMERASGRDLSAFFARWVDGAEPAPAMPSRPDPAK